MNSHNNVIQLDNVSKQFGKKQAVRQVSLQIAQGSITAILGPNGAGKTTTIKMMLGLTSPTSGEIQIFGLPPGHKQVQQRIGVMMQDVSVMDFLTVREIIRMVHSYYPAPLDRVALEKLTGLSPADLNRRAEKLSGGQKRSLNFALAMTGNPDILFFDEPTVGLDSETRRQFWSQIRTLAQQGKTVVFTTHYLHEADEVADRIILFNEGAIAADGTPEQIKNGMTKRTLSFTYIPSLEDSGESAHTENDETTAAANQALIEKLSGVDHVLYQQNRCILQSQDTDALIRQIITMQLPVRDIRIETGQLDDAYASMLNNVKEEQ
ncbi:ABC transporter ATP-binding protein [Paenibacillus polysaccharolyticus]|uniref:ABC transporter ATP-binding protein n=1 Tax=Paenibacillus polysaccharolyticus TaxID=582692 RepID=UPI00209FAD93|nr:ABC transporter ATP-binding protein [Paenibacillus polysaccharolyticus]MCP1136693.1 ABC transporter ATP-binding protein [Paenibacillus polysaccharolyticus]